MKLTSLYRRNFTEENGPVFITKNGYGRLVVMDIEYYEKTMKEVYEAKAIAEALEDIAAKKTKDGDAAISNIRSNIE